MGIQQMLLAGGGLTINRNWYVNASRAVSSGGATITSSFYNDGTSDTTFNWDPIPDLPWVIPTGAGAGNPYWLRAVLTSWNQLTTISGPMKLGMNPTYDIGQPGNVGGDAVGDWIRSSTNPGMYIQVSLSLNGSKVGIFRIEYSLDGVNKAGDLGLFDWELYQGPI